MYTTALRTILENEIVAWPAFPSSFHSDSHIHSHGNGLLLYWTFGCGTDLPHGGGRPSHPIPSRASRLLRRSCDSCASPAHTPDGDADDDDAGTDAGTVLTVFKLTLLRNQSLGSASLLPLSSPRSLARENGKQQQLGETSDHTADLLHATLPATAISIVTKLIRTPAVATMFFRTA